MVVSAGLADIDKTELILSGPSGPNSICTLKDDVPIEVYGAVGFNTPLGPAFCGGKKENYNKQCFIFNSDNEWIPWVDMTTPRVFAAAIQANEHQTLLLGGFGQDGSDVPLKSSELIELESSLGPMDSLKSQATMWRHCIIKINATFGLITGGVHNSHYCAATWYLDLQSFDISPGPRMQNSRVAHGCATFHLGSKTYGIVSGGFNNGREIDSTEFIEFNVENPSWIDGKKN